MKELELEKELVETRLELLAAKDRISHLETFYKEKIEAQAKESSEFFSFYRKQAAVGIDDAVASLAVEVQLLHKHIELMRYASDKNLVELETQLLEKEKECEELKQRINSKESEGIHPDNLEFARELIKEYVVNDYAKVAEELINCKLEKSIAIERAKMLEERLKELNKS